MFSLKKSLLSCKCSWQYVLLVLYLLRSLLCCLFPRLLLHMKRKQSHTPLWTLWHSSNCVLAYIAALKQATKVKKRLSAVLQTNRKETAGWEKPLLDFISRKKMKIIVFYLSSVTQFKLFTHWRFFVYLSWKKVFKFSLFVR